MRIRRSIRPAIILGKATLITLVLYYVGPAVGPDHCIGMFDPGSSQPTSAPPVATPVASVGTVPTVMPSAQNFPEPAFASSVRRLRFA